MKHPENSLLSGVFLGFFTFNLLAAGVVAIYTANSWNQPIQEILWPGLILAVFWTSIRYFVVEGYAGVLEDLPKISSPKLDKKKALKIPFMSGFYLGIIDLICVVFVVGTTTFLFNVFNLDWLHSDFMFLVILVILFLSFALSPLVLSFIQVFRSRARS